MPLTTGIRTPSLSTSLILRSNQHIRDLPRTRAVLTGVSTKASVAAVVAALAFAAAWAMVFSWSEALSLVGADFILALYCVYLFRSRVSLLFLLHPVVILALAQFYTLSFLDLGDGPAYFESTRNALTFYTGIDQTEYLVDLIRAADFKQVYFTFIPVATIPDYLYGTPSELAYFLWQACMHLALLAIAACLALRWQVAERRTVLWVTLFAAISPTFFEVGAVPTRHYVTFFALYLFYVSFTAAVDRLTIVRVGTIAAALALIAMSRLAYLIPVGVFAIYALTVDGRLKRFHNKALFTVVLVLAGWSAAFFAELVTGYRETAADGAATFGFLVRLPVISVFAKYIFALLAPFPWQTASYFIQTAYGGNLPQFLMHVGSSLTGIYFFLRIALRGRTLWHAPKDIRDMLVFGFVLSLAILYGNTAFHVYIAVVLPFFAPLIGYREGRIPLWLPPLVPAVAEAAYSITVRYM